MSTQSNAQSARRFIEDWLTKYGTPKAKLAADIGLPNRNYVYAILNPAAYRSVARLSVAHHVLVAEFCRRNGLRISPKAVRAEYEESLTAVAS